MPPKKRRTFSRVYTQRDLKNLPSKFFMDARQVGVRLVGDPVVTSQLNLFSHQEQVTVTSFIEEQQSVQG